MRAAALFCFAAAALLAAAGAAESAWVGRERALGLGAKKKWVEPSFCGKVPCPPFTVDEKFDGYEQRTYEGGRWAVTNVVRALGAPPLCARGRPFRGAPSAAPRPARRPADRRPRNLKSRADGHQVRARVHKGGRAPYALLQGRERGERGAPRDDADARAAQALQGRVRDGEGLRVQPLGAGAEGGR